MNALNAAQRMQMIEKFEALTMNEYEALNSEIEQLRQSVQELEQEPSVESGGEFKTWWEIALHVGAWKNHELDYVHFGSEMAVRAFAIHLLKQRDKEESQLIQTIAKLTTERDELLAAAEAIEIDAEECLDFDECTAMLVPIDTYHKLMEAIASVKEKQNAAD